MEEQSNVRALPGVKVETPGEPNQGLVKALELLLDRARKGEVTELVGAYALSDGNFGSIIGRNSGDYLGMHGMLHMLLLEHGRRNNGFDQPAQIVTT